jgi:hypothetical protein
MAGFQGRGSNPRVANAHGGERGIKHDGAADQLQFHDALPSFVLVGDDLTRLESMVELPSPERTTSSVRVVTNVVDLSADSVAIPLEIVGDRPT